MGISVFTVTSYRPGEVGRLIHNSTVVHALSKGCGRINYLQTKGEHITTFLSSTLIDMSWGLFASTTLTHLGLDASVSYNGTAQSDSLVVFVELLVLCTLSIGAGTFVSYDKVGTSTKLHDSLVVNSDILASEFYAGWEWQAV